MARLHDDEPDTSPDLVRTLLETQCPELAGLTLAPISATGTDNRLYRLGTELVVRMPRRPGAAEGVRAEIRWLPRLARVLDTNVPEVVHAGEPDASYPYPWAVLNWLDGIDAWESREHTQWFGPELGRQLAELVIRLQAVPTTDAVPRPPGARGGPLAALDDRVRAWLEQADGLFDTTAVARLWDESREAAADEAAPVLLHGDLIPGNILLSDGRLSAVIDWGGVGAGDPAQDLDPYWSILDDAGAETFRESVEADEQTWLRARGNALEQAIGGVIYYTPRRHPLGDVMRRTLERLLSGR